MTDKAEFWNGYNDLLILNDEDYFLYGIDEQIIAEFAQALVNQDKESMKKVLEDVDDRMMGVCFCAAHSSSECCCGAWDD